MSRSRLHHSAPTLETSSPQRQADSWPTGVHPLMNAQRLGGGGNAFAQSLLGPALSGALGACFGPAVQQISIQGGQDATNQAIGALASTSGRRVSLSSKVDPAGGDRQSLEILAHEVAHALAGGGSGKTALDQPGDPGEARADQAGARFADWMEGGMSGPAPRLQAATGGEASVHRWEGAEHKDAVDNAVARRREAGEAVDPSVAATIEQPVTLGNGLELTPGQITALMGDFYGSFDGDGNFDVDASFEQLWNADPKEMQALLDVLARESQGEVISANEWESVTAGRRATGGLTYLDLANQNSNHFSGPTMEGTDNNMGTYAAYHQRALSEATQGTPESANRARALEACASHYLTDRFSAGHQFNKDALMEATDHEAGGILSNIHAKWTHDRMNEQGLYVTSGGEAPESWFAMGDSYWDQDNGQKSNKENQRHTAGAVYSSYEELDAVLQNRATPGELQERGYAAMDKVPQWEPETQAAVDGANQQIDHTFGGDDSILTPYLDDGFAIIGGQYVVSPIKRATNAAVDATVDAAHSLGQNYIEQQKMLMEQGIGYSVP